MKSILIIFISVQFCVGNIYAQNCSALSTGFAPINDLSTGTFTNAWGQVWSGGLYINGSNDLPPTHKTDGLQKASQIQPLDSTGNPDAVNGKIVWLSIGLSNTTQETQQFIPLANAYSNKNPKLILVDGAQGGQPVRIPSSPWNPNYASNWDTVNTRLSNSGVSANQVQVIWFKITERASDYPGGIQPYYDSLVVMYKRMMNEIQVRFPNVQICYMASRISARYATTALNPEPYSYYTGWAVRKVINDQINGDIQLQYSGSNPQSPWLCWGIYMWSDGSTPQLSNPNIFITCPNDLKNDGTHPSPIGATKVANWLFDFYQNDELSCSWFFNNAPSFCAATGITNESISKDLLDIFPNPFSVQTVLQTDNSLTNATLTVYNSFGETVTQIKNINGKTVTFNRNNLASGLYFVRLTQDNKDFMVKKIIIAD